LVVRVNGPGKSVKVRVILIRRGHVYRIVTRTIPTNRTIRVQNLLIPRSVNAVRVSVLS
jgi:hypothetical protein